MCGSVGGLDAGITGSGRTRPKALTFQVVVLASPKTFTILPVQSSPGVKHSSTVGQEDSSTLDDGGDVGGSVCWAVGVGLPPSQ